ncbi:MAG: glycosyltransferase family 4 protein [Candidatus Binatia bacterium]
MTLKICHLISGDLWGGAEVMAFHLLNGLQALPGVDLFVILLNEGRLSEELHGLGIPTYVINESKRSFAEIAWIATEIVRKRAPRIIHSHRYKENILSYLIANTLAKDAVLVSTQHGMPEFYGGFPSMVHRLKSALHYRLVASRFERMVAVSLDIKESLVRDYGFQEKRIQIIHNGISIPETISRNFRMKDYLAIGSAGRFFPVKDYPFMVEVAREVIGKTDKIRFELAGDGPMIGDIQRLIKTYGLEKHFLLRGFLNDVSVFYNGLDVYLNTSIHEGIPISVLEAMAYGLPVIVPKVGGLREIVTDGVDGYIVDARNPKEFAGRCLSLFENSTVRREMGHAARQRISREFATQRMIQNYTDMYVQLIRSNEPGKSL